MTGESEAKYKRRFYFFVPLQRAGRISVLSWYLKAEYCDTIYYYNP